MAAAVFLGVPHILPHMLIFAYINQTVSIKLKINRNRDIEQVCDHRLSVVD